jgi:hypothetical protein
MNENKPAEVGVKLLDAAQRLSNDDADASFWRNHLADWVDLDPDDVTRWVAIDIALADVALGKLRTGEWVAEGFRHGEIRAECPPAAWWQRDIKLNLMSETAEWNGTTLHGLTIFGSDIPACSPKPLSRAQPSQVVVDRWMLKFAGEYQAVNGSKLGRPNAIRECCDPRRGINATARSAGAAYGRLPPALKIGKGERRSK